MKKVGPLQNFQFSKQIYFLSKSCLFVVLFFLVFFLKFEVGQMVQVGRVSILKHFFVGLMFQQVQDYVIRID